MCLIIISMIATWTDIDEHIRVWTKWLPCCRKKNPINFLSKENLLFWLINGLSVSKMTSTPVYPSESVSHFISKAYGNNLSALDNKITTHFAFWTCSLDLVMISFKFRVKRCDISINSLRLSDAYMHQQSRPSLDEIMACRLDGAKPLSEPMRYFGHYNGTWLYYPPNFHCLLPSPFSEAKHILPVINLFPTNYIQLTAIT